MPFVLRASALLAFRTDGKKSHAVAFFDWRPRKITGWLGKNCVSLSG
jgi:hypothetical protein